MPRKYSSCYNIHDLLTVSVNSVRPINDLDREFEFFRCDHINDCNINININISNFKPKLPSTYYILDNKYCISDNYIFYKDTEGCASWKIELFGLETENIVVNFYSKYSYTKYRDTILNPNFLVKDLLLRLIEYLVNTKKGMFLLHSAGVDRNSTAVLLAGRGGSFKTTLTMDLVRYNNFNLLGDDHILCSNNKKVFSFPENLSIFQYMLNNLETERSWTLSKKLGLLYSLEKGESKFCLNIPKFSNLRFIIFITRKKQDDIEIRKLVNLKYISKKLVFNNMVDDLISPYRLGINTGIFLKCLFAYSYIFPQSSISKMYGNLECGLSRLLENVDVFEIGIPYKYNSGISSKIGSFIEYLLEVYT